jgi:integrase
VCGKRLKPLLPLLVSALERHGHLTLDATVRARVLAASAASRSSRKGFFEHAEFVTVRGLLEPQFQNIPAFMYSTGWRIQSEVLRLQWHQIDFVAGEVRLAAGTTKSGEPRVFPLTEDLRQVLAEQQKLTESLGSSHVFCHLAGKRVGKPLSYGGFFKAWLRACGAAGVPSLRPHDFRRTAIRNLERDGVPRSVAMALVGHQTEEVYRRYAIVDEAMIREAAVKMNRGATTRRTTAQSTAQSNAGMADT